MAPTDKEAYDEFQKSGRAPSNYPPFNALIYTVENCVPLVKFGQDDRWQPDPSPTPRPVVSESMSTWKTGLRHTVMSLWDWTLSPRGLRCIRWVMICLGWLLTTFFLAAITGILKTE